MKSSVVMISVFSEMRFLPSAVGSLKFETAGGFPFLRVCHVTLCKKVTNTHYIISDCIGATFTTAVILYSIIP